MGDNLINTRTNKCTHFFGLVGSFWHLCRNRNENVIVGLLFRV